MTAQPRIALATTLAGLIALIVGAFHLNAAEELPPETAHPTGFRPRVVSIEKAKLVVSPGQVIEGGTLVIRDGVIIAVGKDVVPPPGAEKISGEGLVVYPGFIDAAAEAKLPPNAPGPDAGRAVKFEENLLAATRPDNRRGMTPEFQLTEHALLDAEFQSARRKAGITDLHLVHFAPVAGGTEGKGGHESQTADGQGKTRHRGNSS